MQIHLSTLTLRLTSYENYLNADIYIPTEVIAITAQN